MSGHRRAMRSVVHGPLALVAALGATLLFAAQALATDYSVGDTLGLRQAIGLAVDGDTINFAQDITLGDDLPAVQASITINGQNHTLSGNNQFRGFFVGKWTAGTSTQVPVTVAIQDLTIQNARATGGAGGANGGGGAGLGGALFVANLATVTATNPSNPTTRAAGGAGGASGSGGGGDSGGGGGVGIHATGGDAGSNAGGPGIISGAAGGAAGDTTGSGPGGAGGASGGGGGGSPGGGGGGGGGGVGGLGVAGGFGGGGGGSGGGGGAGGFGGGGGGGDTNPGGVGGFGGGGGGASPSGGTGGFGAGVGASGNLGNPGGFGGGGAGLGGAIFVQQGGTLTISGPLTLNGNTVTGGNAGGGTATSGSAFGSGIFVQGNDAGNAGAGSLTFSPAVGEVQTVSNAIADQTGSGGSGGSAGAWGLNKAGLGTLVLDGANTYTGATTVSAGSLQAGAANAFAPSSAHSVASGATLDLNSFNQTIGSLAGAGNVTLGSGALTTGGDDSDTTFSGVIGGSGAMNKVGTGTMTLTGANTSSGVTAVGGGTLAVNGSISSGIAVTPSGILAGTGTVGDMGSQGTVAPGNSVGTLHTGAAVLTTGSHYAAQIDSSGADRLHATGVVDLGGSNLDLTLLGSYVQTPGTLYTIIANDGSDPVSGTFSGLPQGATFTIGGKAFRISYTGGPGHNDVTLRALASPTLTTDASANTTIGHQIRDIATLSAGLGPTGTITFRLYGPGDDTCAGPPAFTSTKTVSGNGGYPSDKFTPTMAGIYHWTARYSGDSNNAAVTKPCSSRKESNWVQKASPALTTQASLTAGGKIVDKASISGGKDPSGELAFKLYGPNDTQCSQTPVFTDRVAVSGNGGYRTRPFRPPAQGTYRFRAVLPAEVNNRSAHSACNAAGESVRVG